MGLWYRHRHRRHSIGGAIPRRRRHRCERGPAGTGASSLARHLATLREAEWDPDGTASLVTVAQAAHWFDLDAFYREVDRVLKPGGVVALWCYGILGIDAGVDRILHRFEHERVGPYWPEERRHVDAEYRTLLFPYRRIDTPHFVMEATLSRADCWIPGELVAVSRYRTATGAEPLTDLDAELAPLARDGTEARALAAYRRCRSRRLMSAARPAAMRYVAAAPQRKSSWQHSSTRVSR